MSDLEVKPSRGFPAERASTGQNAVESLSIPSVIVHMDDARKNRRPKVNSISLRRKRKPSKGFGN
jgi:hypothetical protein